MNITDWLEDLRYYIAKKICPSMEIAAERYWLLLDDVHEVEQFIGRDISEVKQALNWIIGKNCARDGEDTDQRYGAWTASSYMKYRSLAHFKDVLLNEYKRKSKT